MILPRIISNKASSWGLTPRVVLASLDVQLASSSLNTASASAFFATSPHLPHGPNGIIVGHDVCIGENIIIYQQVTISQGRVVIGHNVILGAGAKILPNVCIGNNVKVGANCVVVEDIPANATVVLPKPRIILKQG